MKTKSLILACAATVIGFATSSTYASAQHPLKSPGAVHFQKAPQTKEAGCGAMCKAMTPAECAPMTPAKCAAMCKAKMAGCKMGDAKAKSVSPAVKGDHRNRARGFRSGKNAVRF